MKKIIYYAIVGILLFSLIFMTGNQAAGAQASTGQLETFVWDDTDRDGIQDAGEPGRAGVTVDLYRKPNDIVDTVNTDANGLAVFSELPPGDYYVRVVPPAGYSFTRRDRGDNDDLDSDTHLVTGKTGWITLAAGQTIQTWDAGLYLWSASPGPGTVRPPATEIIACRDDNYSVGGVAGLIVSSLQRGYCLNAFLRNQSFALGRIPDGAGRILANITFLRVFYNSRFAYEIPLDQGDIQICYAIPTTVTEAQIYFFDFYGPRFGKRTGQPSWEPLETTVQDHRACAPAQTSGAYALIGE